MQCGDIVEGRFEIRDVLGEGGMGQVFKAWDTELGRFVAIKTMLQQFMSDPAALDEMKHEVKISQRLNHPGIVAVYDYRVHDRTPYIIMEFVDGLPMHHYLFRQTARRVDEVSFLALADQILNAVGHAHDQGVVHRDLKPANIMVLPSGHTKLMDFGIAAAVRATFTRITGHSSGLTVQYSSPEQIRGEAPHPSMDIYSLGCVFYEMLTGHPPFHQGEVIYQQLSREAPPLPGVSARINDVVLACLVKDPRRRFPTAASVRAALAGKGMPADGPGPDAATVGDPVAAGRWPDAWSADAARPTPQDRQAGASRASPRFMPVVLAVGIGAVGVLMLVTAILWGLAPNQTTVPSERQNTALVAGALKLPSPAANDEPPPDTRPATSRVVDRPQATATQTQVQVLTRTPEPRAPSPPPAQQVSPAPIPRELPETGQADQALDSEANDRRIEILAAYRNADYERGYGLLEAARTWARASSLRQRSYESMRAEAVRSLLVIAEGLLDDARCSACRAALRIDRRSAAANECVQQDCRDSRLPEEQ